MWPKLATNRHKLGEMTERAKIGDFNRIETRRGLQWRTINAHFGLNLRESYDLRK
jgi:hypothetical protein